MQAYPTPPHFLFWWPNISFYKKKIQTKNNTTSYCIFDGLCYANVCAVNAVWMRYRLLELFDLYHDEWVLFKFVAFSPYRFFHGIRF